jgi:hypothetical protein
MAPKFKKTILRKRISLSPHCLISDIFPEGQAPQRIPTKGPGHEKAHWEAPFGRLLFWRLASGRYMAYKALSQQKNFSFGRLFARI